MMDEIQIITLVTRHLEIWGETDAQVRKMSIREIYAEELEVVDPFCIITNQDDLNNFITDLQSNHPGHHFYVLEAIEHHHHIARLKWQYAPPGKIDAITGQDIFVFGNGRIEKLYIFIDGVNPVRQ